MRKYKEGYTSEEINELLETKYPSISYDDFADKLGVVTGIMRDGDFIYFEDDVEKAIRCCIERRDLNSFEWD